MTAEQDNLPELEQRLMTTTTIVENFAPSADKK